MPSLPFDDYGVIGNSATSALVSRLGSIDWCCFPSLDSPPHFGALLDGARGGSFRLQPSGEFRSEQRYPLRGRVLETLFETPTGRGLLVDWMPKEARGDEPPIICRKIATIDGSIEWNLSCAPRFGGVQAEVERSRGHVLFRGASLQESGRLVSDVPLQLSLSRGEAHARIRLDARQSARFSWSWGRLSAIPSQPEPEPSLLRWRGLAHRCPRPGPCPLGGAWHDLIAGSGLVLKLLHAAHSGAVAHAVAPAHAGDPRVARLWDAPWLLRALSALGLTEERDSYFEFMCDVLERDGASGIQAEYGLDGSRSLGGPGPVFQLGVHGQVALAIATYQDLTGRLSERAARGLADLAEFTCQAWRRPDQDPLEPPTRPEHYLSSKLLCWSALDLASARLADQAPPRWRRERDILASTIISQGFDRRLGSFTRSFSSRELGVGALFAPILGFLPPGDPRISGTLQAISSHLAVSPAGKLKGGLLLTAGLARSGRVDEAAEVLSELCSYASSLGLFGEELTGTEPTGAFPCASVHAQLVCAALDINEAQASQTLHQTG